MEVGTLLVFAICACVVAGVLRQYSPGFAIVFSLGCACFLLLRGLALARPVFDFLNQLNSQLNGDALADAIKNAIKAKEANLKGQMASEGTTPRRLTDLIGSLCDLTSGSGDKGTPIVLVQNYFNNYAN